MKGRKALVLVALAAALAGILLLIRFAWTPGSSIPPTGCPEQALVYVYATEEQRGAADKVVSDLKMMLQYQGVNVLNVPMCVAPAASFPRVFQVYPALLVRGNVSVPSAFISSTLDGYKELYPLIPAMIAQQRGVKLLYGYTGEVIVVQSKAPLTNVSTSALQQLREGLSLVFLVNITRISDTHDAELASRLSVLPGIVVKSSYNLTRGAPYIVELKPGVYTLAERYQRVLLQNLGIFAYEIRNNPLQGFESGVPVGGEGAATLYVLEDYHCPFCARFINSTGNFLVALAREGRIRVVFVDLIVHSEVSPIHAFTHCLYNLTGNSYLYVDVTQELYRAFLAGKQTTLDYAVSYAKNYVPQEVVNASLACAKRVESELLAASTTLQSMGFTGTPTFIFWNDSAGRGLLVEGCIDVNVCLSREDLTRILEWLYEG